MEMDQLRAVSQHEIQEAAQRWLTDVESHTTSRQGKSSLYTFTNIATNWFRYNKLLVALQAAFHPALHWELSIQRLLVLDVGWGTPRVNLINIAFRRLRVLETEARNRLQTGENGNLLSNAPHVLPLLRVAGAERGHGMAVLVRWNCDRSPASDDGPRLSS